MASLGLARAVLDMGLRELVRSGNLIPPPVSLSPLCSFVIRMESLLEASQTGAGGTLLSIREEQARDYARGKKLVLAFQCSSNLRAVSSSTTSINGSVSAAKKCKLLKRLM